MLVKRNDKAKQFFLTINEYGSGKKISHDFGEGLSLASAYVDGNTLYVFGTKDWTKYGESAIYQIKSDNLKDFSEPMLIYKAKEGQRIFNTSVTKNIKTGKFAMAIEVDETGFTPFSIQFLLSDDANIWEMDESNVFGKEIYVACPTLKYVEGYYYLLYGVEDFYDPNCKDCKKYITKISRSKDLYKWESSAIPFLIPLTDGSEGLSAADVDMAEYNDKTYILYSISDQSTWGSMKSATFNGATERLFNIFF